MLIAIALLSPVLAWVGSVIKLQRGQEALLVSLNETAHSVVAGKQWPCWQRGSSMDPDRWPSAGCVVYLECWARGTALPALARIDALPHLERIRLYAVSLGREEEAAIAALPRLEEFVMLDLDSLEEDAVDRRDVPSFRLECLFDVYDIDDLAFVTLEELGLSEDRGQRRAARWKTPLSSAGMRALANSPRLTRLTVPLKSLDEVGPSLERLRSLQQLCLIGCRVSDKACASLSKVTALEDLYLTECDISNEGIASLSALCDLRRLRLTRCRISNAGIGALAAFRKLEVLQLNSPFITDEGVKQLSMLPLRKSLTSLDLSGCSIGDAAMRPILRFGCLRELALDGTSVSDAGLVVLAESRSLARGSVNVDSGRIVNAKLWDCYLRGGSAEELRGILQQTEGERVKY